MKRFALLIATLLLCGIAAAHTINWRVDGNIYQTTTCDSGESITPPTPPYKYGYHFKEWDPLYTRIEYLASTGSQWFNTGISGKNGITTEMQLIINNPSQGCALGVGSITSQFYPVFWYNGKWDSVVGPDNITSDISANVVYTTIFESGSWGYKFYVNGILTNSGNNVLSLGNMFMFARPDHSYPMRGAIYYCKIYDNDILLRDFIPVLDTYGTPCMYDRVEKKYYYNQGTGQFIAGPVISE